MADEPTTDQVIALEDAINAVLDAGWTEDDLADRVDEVLANRGADS